jgi:hypothetical protein
LYYFRATEKGLSGKELEPVANNAEAMLAESEWIALCQERGFWY